MSKNIEEYIDDYLKRGFGSMNKNDFEVFIFGYLLETKLKGKSDYEISILLKVPQPKVKRLRYESSLKKGNKDYSVEFDNVLRQVKVKTDSSKLQFVVEDVALRKYLDSKLKQDGRFADSSFNSEIVVIDRSDLIYLMEKTCSEEVQKLIKGSLNKDSFKKAVSELIENIIGKGVSTIIDLSASSLKNIACASANDIKK